MEELISVIVPIYKVEEYLNRCVDSIINQTYKNLEIILVDDGSPDSCPKICDDYAIKDSRIKVIHKKNGGLSSARNAGLDVATGKYISFIDSDDWIEKNLYSVESYLLLKHNVDLVKPSFVYGDFDEQNNLSKVEKIKVLDSYELFQNICLRKVETSVCGSLWKREIFDGFRFPEKILNEDFLFSARLFMKRKLQIIFTEYCGYTYFNRPGSISKQGFGKSIVDAVYNTKESIDIAKEYCPKLEKYCRGYNVYQSRTALIIMPKDRYKRDKDFVRYCTKTIRENRKYILHSFMSKKDKLFCYCCIISPTVARFFSKILIRKKKGNKYGRAEI